MQSWEISRVDFTNQKNPIFDRIPLLLDIGADLGYNVDNVDRALRVQQTRGYFSELCEGQESVRLPQQAPIEMARIHYQMRGRTSWLSDCEGAIRSCLFRPEITNDEITRVAAILLGNAPQAGDDQVMRNLACRYRSVDVLADKNVYQMILRLNQ
jgi:hypothetical protein